MPHQLLQKALGKIDGPNRDTVEKIIWLAVEIAREGREGRKVGTLFVISDSDKVLLQSRPLILDPLFGHPDRIKHIDHPGMRETIKELALLDGAFIVSDSGVFVSACRYIDASTQDIDMPLGLGSRHLAGASITKHTRSVAVIVSESSMVRVLFAGEIISEIIPEVWLMTKYGLHVKGKHLEEKEGDLIVVSKT